MELVRLPLGADLLDEQHRFWRLFKASVRPTHIQVSGEKMPKYLAEFCYRSNYRQFGNAMFDLLISRV